MLYFKKFMVSITLIFLVAYTLSAQEKIGNRIIKQGMWNNEQVEYADRQIAIKIKAGVQTQDVLPLLSQHKAVLVDSFDKLHWGLIELPEGVDIFPVINALKSNSMIENIEPNMVTRTHFEPNDPYYLDGHQWALKNTGQSPPGGTNDADIDAPEAWNITRGNSSIIIAILDTGIPLDTITLTLSHPDLNDANKFILGPDYINDNEGVRDRYGHGTHVAGIASAETNNSTGIAGVAGSCKIMVIQVFDSTGGGTWTAFKNGVIYAVDNGAKIINYSGGGPSYSSEAEDAVKYAYDNGVFMSISAGNQNGGSVTYPGRFSAYGTYSGHTSGYSNITCVSATDPNDVFSTYSSKGSQVSVSAPGGRGLPFSSDDIFSTTPNYPFKIQLSYPEVTQSYGYLAGTSMAAPHVAGIAGLLLSVNSSLTPSQIRDIIQQTAEDKGTTGRDDYYGWGRVNANQAVLLAIAYANKSATYYAGYNNAHLMERGFSGKLHEVFHSGGEIFYRRSSNNGSSWELTTRLSSGNSANEAPSIASCFIGSDDILCAIWQKEIDVYHYSIWYSISSNTGTSWSAPAIVPGCSNVLISNSQSKNDYGGGSTPVIASFSGLGYPGFLLVYAAENGLHYRYFNTYYSSWTIPGSDIIPGTSGSSSTIWFPSLATYNSQDYYGGYYRVNLIYDDRYNHVYSQFFNILNGFVSWTTRVQVSTSGTSNNRLSSIAVDNENNRLAVWSGWNGSNYSIKFRKGFADGSWGTWNKTWSISGVNLMHPVITYYNRGGSNPYGIDILFHTSTTNQIRQKRYNGNGTSDVWLPADPNTQLLASTGLFANITHERQNTPVPVQMWSHQNAPFYPILYNSSYLPKETISASGDIRRAALVGDSQSNSGLSFEISQPVIKLSNGESTLIPFKEFDYEAKLSLSFSNIFDYLQTESIHVPEDAESISFTFEVKSSQPDTLSDGYLNSNKKTPFENISFSLLAKDMTAQNIIASLSNQSLSDKSGNHNFSKTFETSVQSFKNKNVFLIPKVEMKGSFNEKDLQFSLENISIEGSSLPKDSTFLTETSLPKEYFLGQNYPNPFNPVTQIKYSILDGGSVHLVVYDILGREIATLVNEEKPAGTYTINFDARNLSSGVYFYSITAGKFSQTRKMILVK